MKYIHSQKGSTLMLVVITIAILTMLGTALLSMSLMNINMKHNDYRLKKTLYYAESGIDQVYARVGKVVESAILDSIEQTDNEVEVMISEITTMLESDAPMLHVDWAKYRDYVTDEGDGIYMLNTKKLKDESDIIYKRKFRAYFNGLDEDADATNDMSYVLLNSDYIYLDDNDTSNNSEITIAIDSTDISEFTGAGTTYAIRNIKSTFKYMGITEKEISTDIIITDTVASYPLTTLEKRIEVPDNPIWQKALVAHKDIEFTNTIATINGDMYGYGTMPTDTVNARPIDFGGIIGSGNSQVVVNGNMYSRSYIQLAPNSSANITVNNGLTYANTVIVQKGATGNLVVNGNVYTSDDLEHNGNGSKLIINGSYYGYTDNSSIGSTHDASSAIVINADIEKAGFQLAINGATNSALDYEESNAGILIGGTAYVDVRPERYQTAESVSIKGNFVAYTWMFDQSIIDDLNSNNFFSQAKYNFYEPSAHDARVNANIRDTTWQTVNGSSLKLANKGNLDDRKAYFIAFKEKIDLENSYIKTGTPSNIALGNYIYTVGLKLLGNDFVNNGNDFGSEIYETLKSKISKDYLFQLHKLNYRNGADINTIESQNGAEATVQNINVVDKYTKIDQAGSLTESTLSDANGILSGVAVKEVKYVNNATSNILHIYGSNYSGTIVEPSIQASQLQGIILNAGDIEIYGDVTFVGTMISKGSIKTYSGRQTYTNNTEVVKEYLAELIYTDDILYSQFDVAQSGGPGVDRVTIGTIEYVEILPPSKPNDSKNNIYTYNDLIYFEHWKVVK